MMRPELHEFPNMVNELAKGGFHEDQAKALVVFVAELFARHHRFHEEERNLREEERKQTQEQFAAIHRRFDEERKETQAQFDSLKRWLIGTLTTLLLPIVVAAALFMLRL